MPSNGKKTSPETIENAERKAKAVELRKEGRTFEEIAQECGYNSRQAAYEAVKSCIDAIIEEPARDLLKLDLERLDKMFGIHYLNAQAGDVMALNGCLRIMERRARLLGLDAPVKQEVKNETTVTGGVLRVPMPLDEKDWFAAVAKSQDELKAKETAVVQAPQQTAARVRRRVE